MKQHTDKFILEMFGNRVGRPPKVHPVSAAERLAKYVKRKAQKQALISVTNDKNYCYCDHQIKHCSGECFIAQYGR